MAIEINEGIEYRIVNHHQIDRQTNIVTITKQSRICALINPNQFKGQKNHPLQVRL